MVRVKRMSTDVFVLTEGVHCSNVCHFQIVRLEDGEPAVGVNGRNVALLLEASRVIHQLFAAASVAVGADLMAVASLRQVLSNFH